jgi:hypothetical protein
VNELREERPVSGVASCYVHRWDSCRSSAWAYRKFTPFLLEGVLKKEQYSMRTRVAVIIGLSLVLTGTAWLSSKSTADTSTPADQYFDQQLYDFYQSQQLLSLQDLTGNYIDEQYNWLPVLPPDPSWTTLQEKGVVLFDDKAFPKEFLTALVPSVSAEITTYPVTAYEDPKTHEIVYLNAKDEEIGRVTRELDYKVDWIALEYFPNLYSMGYDERQNILALFNPCRLAVRYQLITQSELIQYVIKQTADKQAMAQQDNGGGIQPMRYDGPPVDHLKITSIEITNNIAGGVTNPVLTLTIAYPWTDGVPTNSYTNGIEVFGCSNLIDYWWFSLGVTNPVSTTNWVEWTDTNYYPTSTTAIRLYRVGNAQEDSDGDLLTDARELLMYHSNPNNTNTDGDAYSDYYEVMTLNTDPANSNTTIPTVTITFPTNNYTSIWMP